MNKGEVIVGTWGIGPTYRKRVLHHIQKSIDSGYDNIFPYVVLTDKPDDFYEIQEKTGLIEKIVNVHTEREIYSKWSKEYEFIPNSLTEKEYGSEFRTELFLKNRSFSYGLHRFYFPTISQLGYRKFLHCDSDFDIRYDKIVSGQCTEKEFMDQFDTPVYTMKGCDLETFTIDEHRWRSPWNNSNIILACHLRYILSKEFGIESYKHLTPFFTQTEGPFRFYHFELPEDIHKYFTYYDKGVEIVLKDEVFRKHCQPQIYAYVDNVIAAVVNELMNIEPLLFSKDWHTANIYYEDRHFLPTGHIVHFPDGEALSLQDTDSVSEFLEKNNKLLKFIMPNRYE